MNREEFLQKVKEENIPDEWYSLDDGKEAPIKLREKTLSYGKFGYTNFLMDINYEVILEKLYEYRKQQKFMTSDEEIEIRHISIEHEYWIDEYLGNKRFKLTERTFEGENDSTLLKDGWSYSHYDRYMGDWIYTKEAGMEIFTDIEISFRKKTSDLDRRTFGFTDELMSTSIRYVIPVELKWKIFKYISEQKQTGIEKDCQLWKDIVNYYTIPEIIKEEYERLVFAEECYRNTLNYELKRQELLGIISNEALLEVYESMKVERIFSKGLVAGSRPDVVIDRVIDEAEAVLERRKRDLL